MNLANPQVGSFVILPYLNTSETAFLCGFELHSASDISHLPDSAKEHWSTISSLFYLRDHLRITNPTFTYLTPEMDADRAGVAKKLQTLQACLSYLYTSPSPNRKPFFHWEHTSMFWLRPNQVSDYHLWPKHGTYNEISSDERPPLDDQHTMEGYSGLLNGIDDIDVVAHSRLYPSIRNLWLNNSQDMAWELMEWRNRTSNWALQIFFEREESFLEPNFATTERIINAIDWHNRGTSLSLTEEGELLHLAIAFEALLNLDNGPGVTDRFKGTVKTLLGSIERLDWWAEQFYTARSKIVHRGGWGHLGFYPVDSKMHRKIVSAKTPDDTLTPHGNLLNYGRHIFRLCVQSIVHASVLSWQTNLSKSLLSDEDRLKAIVERLKDKTQPALQRLESVVPLVADFHELDFRDDKTVKAETLVGTAKRLAQTYVQLKSVGIPPQVTTLLNQLIGSAEVAQHLETIRNLADELDKWRCPRAPHTHYGLGEAQKTDSISVVWSFCDYFRFKAYYLQ